MSRPILLLCVLMAVLALAEAGRQRRQLINAIVGAALGSTGYGQPYYGGGYGGFNQQGYGSYGRPAGYGGYNQGYNQQGYGYNQGYNPYSYNQQQQGYYRPTNYYG